MQAYCPRSSPTAAPTTSPPPPPDTTTGIYRRPPQLRRRRPVGFRLPGSRPIPPNGAGDPPPRAQVGLPSQRLLRELGSLYPVDGSTKDLAYGRLGIPAYTFEMGTRLLRALRQLRGHVCRQPRDAALRRGRRRAPTRLPNGPDVVSPAALADAWSRRAPRSPSQRARPTTPASAPGAAPSHPADRRRRGLRRPAAWAPGAVAVPLAAADGVFNRRSRRSPAPSTPPAWPPAATPVPARARRRARLGRRSPAPSSGARSARGRAASSTGTVRAAGTGAPLAATLSTASFTTALDPADGGYSPAGPPGTYDVTASGARPPDRDGRAPSSPRSSLRRPATSSLGPTRSSSPTTARGAPGWTAQSPWALTRPRGRRQPDPQPGATSRAVSTPTT